MTLDALLSLGGNIGDRKATVDAAVTRIAALPGTVVSARSSYYRAEPAGPVAQAWFLNIAIALTTQLDLAALAAACRAIESGLGRDRLREIPSGPRTIDIDVIAVGKDGDLMPAGAELDERAFVLVPLQEIAARVAIAGITVAARLASAPATGVERLDWPLPDRP